MVEDEVAGQEDDYCREGDVGEVAGGGSGPVEDRVPGGGDDPGHGVCHHQPLKICGKYSYRVKYGGREEPRLEDHPPDELDVPEVDVQGREGEGEAEDEDEEEGEYWWEVEDRRRRRHPEDGHEGDEDDELEGGHHQRRGAG